MGGDGVCGANARCCWVSIHAPAWGATLYPIMDTSKTMFQSTPPRGGRQETPHSITFEFERFNPRPRVGGDMRDNIYPDMLKSFQSTPPRGGRHIDGLPIFLTISFNPRPRVGGDLTDVKIYQSQIVSIHAPAWGATVVQRSVAQLVVCFNPRPRVGGDFLK